VGQQVVGDAPAVVLDLDDHLVVGLLTAQDDPAALLGVCDGVVQQVADHLGDAHAVGEHQQWLDGQLGLQLVAALLQRRADRGHRLFQHLLQVHRPPAQLDLCPS
jgi:hypothetical protein